jgi:hypothetical protein
VTGYVEGASACAYTLVAANNAAPTNETKRIDRIICLYPAASEFITLFHSSGLTSRTVCHSARLACSKILFGHGFNRDDELLYSSGFSP